MKELILALLLITYTASQQESIMFNPGRVAFGDGPVSDSVGPTSSSPSDGMTMDSAGSDTANVQMEKSAPVAPAPMMIMSRTSAYESANNAWSSLQRLGGGCCDNCKKICGFAIKLHGTNRYLTNMGTWYQFRPSTNPNATQIFTMGQNADCTWSFSNRGSFLSTSSNFAGNWVGSAGTIGANERWYIERGGPYVYIQSASSQYWYWRASSFPNYFLGYSYGSASRLTMEYYPCDKNFGWNW
jgi:hypothetical protein